MQKRSLYQIMFGNRPKVNDTDKNYFRVLNGFVPTFTPFSGNAYDSDVVRSTVDAIARNAAKFKPKHVRRVNGEIVKTESNLEKLLQVRPNPFMNSFAFLYKVVTLLMMTNNAFVYIDWDDETGDVRGLYPIDFSTVDFLEARNQPGEVYARFRFRGGQAVTLPYEDLIHLRRFFYKDDMFGETSEKALTPTLELINTTDQGIANAVKSSAFLRGLLKFTTMLKPEDLKKQRDDFVKDYLDVSNNGGVAATDSKTEYQELKNDPKMIDDKQMAAIKDKVYKYFSVNEKIIASNYSEDEWNAFYESVLEPLAIQMSLEFTAKIFTNRERSNGNEIIFEANRLQYASNGTKIKLIETLVDRGLLNKNEGREIFNLGPIPGGDKYIVSLNFVQADKANKYQLGEDENEGGN
ncbi:phage portal protein [Paenibacillus flagellatus]|uniref:Phage portal protein n=1 Tax=Paenibacillus flagellatus TaxID=2211139 RepID=A0A2V5K567_9BACL|nr:phage portal protein [Paenibacillus flagellatus]PYI54499.1 phage portal protein [Paenibacillus flagellatus]